jgi:hypothetical protein
MLGVIAVSRKRPHRVRIFVCISGGFYSIHQLMSDGMIDVNGIGPDYEIHCGKRTDTMTHVSETGQTTILWAMYSQTDHQ